MGIARNLRRSGKMRQKHLVKMTNPETPAAKQLRKAFLEGAVPHQLREGAMPELDDSPTSEHETKKERRWRLALTWIARILTFGLGFRKKG